MGIVMGALAGLGEAAVDIGRRNQIAQLEQEKEARGYQQQTDLTKLRADLEEQKAMSLEKFKREQGLQEKTRIGGIVTGAMKAKQADIEAGQDPFGANPSQAENRRAVTKSPMDALLASGDIDAAKAYAQAQTEGQKTIGYGSTLVDPITGEKIFDNGSEVRAQAALQTTAAKQQMAEAATTRANNRGKVQPLDQTELGKVNEQIGKYVKSQYSSVKNPFAQPGAEDTTDGAKQSLAVNTLSKLANDAGMEGKALNVPGAMTKLQPILNKYDAEITAQANKMGDAIFDEKGKPIPDRIEQWKGAGYPASVLTNKTAFQDYYRNKALQDTNKFEAYVTAMSDKDLQTPAKAAPTQLAAAPAKPAGIASNAAAVATPPKEEAPAMSKTEQLRQQQAQTEKRNRAEESLKASDPDLKALKSQVQAAITKNDLGGARKLNDQYDQLLQAKLSKI